MLTQPHHSCLSQENRAKTLNYICLLETPALSKAKKHSLMLRESCQRGEVNLSTKQSTKRTLTHHRAAYREAISSSMDANQTFFHPAYEPPFPCLFQDWHGPRAGVAFQTGNRWLGSEEEEGQ